MSHLSNIRFLSLIYKRMLTILFIQMFIWTNMTIDHHLILPILSNFALSPYPSSTDFVQSTWRKDTLGKKVFVKESTWNPLILPTCTPHLPYSPNSKLGSILFVENCGLSFLWHYFWEKSLWERVHLNPLILPFTSFHPCFPSPRHPYTK